MIVPWHFEGVRKDPLSSEFRARTQTEAEKLSSESSELLPPQGPPRVIFFLGEEFGGSAKLALVSFADPLVQVFYYAKSCRTRKAPQKLVGTEFGP